MENLKIGQIALRKHIEKIKKDRKSKTGQEE